MEKEIIFRLHENLEKLKQEKDDIEFWFARDLQNIFKYVDWRNFLKVIEKAEESCKNSKEEIGNHFIEIKKEIRLGNDAPKNIPDIMLTRYACYLIAQNGDSSKEEIAFAQSYFAVQTRKQELIEQRIKLTERITARKKLTTSEKEFSHIVFQRGVDSQGFARIKGKGDTALFGGYSTSNMKKKLNIPENRPLADFLPTITIKAKDLANEITSHNLKNNKNLKGEEIITGEHVKNNENMREMLYKSGIAPESLPPEEDVKKIERRVVSENKKIVKSIKKFKKT
ncbi:MAG: DNA damage-inducible protein D [Candidatus Paceibacterota bacterium]